MWKLAFHPGVELLDCYILNRGNHNDYKTTVTCSLPSRETGQPSGWPVSFWIKKDWQSQP